MYNRPLTLTATVAPTNANGYSIKGDQVQFSVSNGTGVTATGFSQLVTVSGGVATATFTGLPVGQYNVSAYFEGDANFLFSTSATIPLQVTVPSPGDPELSGTYTFHFTGTLPSGAGFIPGIAGAGWFQADGAGNITAGEEDINTAIGTETATSVTGSFALAANGTGTLTLTNTQGVTLNFGVIAGPTTTTYPSGGYGPITTTNQLSLIGLSNEGAVLTGSAVTQPTGPSTFTLSGNYLLRALGDTGCSNGCSVHPNGQVSLVGTLTGSGQTATGLAVENAGGAVAVDNATTFTFSAPDANGRFTATHTNNFGYPDQPQHYVGYWLSASELYLLSIDPHASTTLLSGTLTLQQ